MLVSDRTPQREQPERVRSNPVPSIVDGPRLLLRRGLKCGALASARRRSARLRCGRGAGVSDDVWK